MDMSIAMSLTAETELFGKAALCRDRETTRWTKQTPRDSDGKGEGECNRSPSRNLEMLRNLGLLSLIGYLVQTPEYRSPQFTALTTSVCSALIKNLQHPSMAYSRISDLLNKPNVRLGQTQLGFNTVTTTS
jgi:hypothetical protein